MIQYRKGTLDVFLIPLYLIVWFLLQYPAGLYTIALGGWPDSPVFTGLMALLIFGSGDAIGIGWGIRYWNRKDLIGYVAWLLLVSPALCHIFFVLFLTMGKLTEP